MSKKKHLKKQLHKKYECTMNVIPEPQSLNGLICC